VRTLHPLGTRAVHASRRERGQASLELVLVLPLVITLVSVCVQAGVLVRDRVRLGHAAREAARSAMVGGGVGAAAAAAASARLEPDRLEVRVEGGSLPGDRLVVTVRYRAPTDVVIVGQLLPDVVIEERLVTRRE